VTSEGDDDERHGLPASRLASTLGVPVIAEGIERPARAPAEVGDLELAPARLATLA
jgi:hypothetical protein